MSEQPSTPTLVVAAVIERQGRYLVCQRPADKHHGGLWEFPGGKLKAGEDLSQAARRELREELGVVVDRVGKMLSSLDDSDGQFRIVFVPVWISGEPRCLEHQAISWLTPGEMSGRALAPADARFAEFLGGAED